MRQNADDHDGTGCNDDDEDGGDDEGGDDDGGDDGDDNISQR